MQRPRRLIVKVQAGQATDDVIAEYAPLLDPGDVIVDTSRREATLSESGVHFLGTGISGGEEGALNGPSSMRGGSPHAYQLLAPELNDIAAATPDGSPAVAPPRPRWRGPLRENGPQRH